MEKSETPATVDNAAAIHKGVVNWFDAGKGYGFIDSNEGGDALFVHHSAIEHGDGYFRKLVSKEEVEFQVETAADGRHRAIHVTGPSGQPVQAILQQQSRGPPPNNDA